MILLAFRHDLRASELVDLQWSQVELDAGRIHVTRAKNGTPSTHPLTGREIRAVRQLRRENLQSRFVFNTERGGPFTTDAFLKLIRKAGELAKLPFPVHPHMLRHACGFKLANDGQDTRALQHYLGHKNSSTRFATPSCAAIGSTDSSRTDLVRRGARSGTSSSPADHERKPTLKHLPAPMPFSTGYFRHARPVLGQRITVVIKTNSMLVRRHFKYKTP
jgi:type 1 fimbriae regulatory protein FimB/type 1 fimbriae regulatory protein FimE